MVGLRSFAQRQLGKVDKAYQSRHRLRPVGKVLVAGRARHHGSPKAFPDGTRIAAGDPIGALHFNNLSFTRLQADTSRRAASQFSHLMLDSLRALACLAREDAEFSDLAAYHAVSWLPPHGKRLGFVTEPFPEGIRKRLLAAYFRLLVWTFAPARDARSSAKPDPTLYWLTRRELLRRFGDTQEG